mmetsp:Transcript_9226/g.32056  ORF Transcript_9226/g.32056 Transcript_9226/m.32056 type:complete len:183 (+) Transcript_9226:37-585(+)
MALAMGETLAGGRVAARRATRKGSRAASLVVRAERKKVISYDDNWARGAVTTGIFVEDGEATSRNFLKSAEKKKLLSQVESAGLLSAAEKAGLTLSKIESLKLLSTAEKLGALSLLESVANTDGAVISSLSIPFFLATALGVVLIPDDTTLELAAQAALLLVGGGGFLTLFLGGFLVNALNE